MQAYIARRVLFGIVTLFGLSLVVSSMVRLIPGNAVTTLAADTGSSMSAASQRAIEHQLELDRSYPQQYLDWLGGIFRGDLGQSLLTGKSVGSQVRSTFPVSLEIALLSMAITALAGITIGVLSAARQDTSFDYTIRTLSIVWLAIPSFAIGTVLVLVLSVVFKWLPPLGFVSLRSDPLRNLQQVVFPVLIIGTQLSAIVARFARSATLEVMRDDYVRTARAKGLTEWLVFKRHVVRNAMLPVITVLGTELGALLGGTIIMESVFALPGFGSLTVNAVQHRDYPQVQGDVLIFGALIVLVNLIVDVLYSVLNPQVSAA